VLTGAAALATSSLAAGSASAKSGISGEDVPVPNVKGPIVGGEATGEPQTASVPDLSEYGYIEEAYFISGEARALGHAELFAEEWEEPPNESAEYTTRLLIFRPEDPADFNGGVVVNWPNVSDDHDVPFVWFNVYDYVVREGYAFAIASSQKIGVDEYSYDMFSQAVQALREHPDPDPMGGLETTRVLATGISQSAIYFRYYISEVQADHQVTDGFLPTVIPQPSEGRNDIPDDLVPILLITSEDEAMSRLTGEDEASEQRADSGLFKLWEVTGTSHVNHWAGEQLNQMIRRDHLGEDPDWNEGLAGQYGQRDDGKYGACPSVFEDIWPDSVTGSLNYFPMRYAYAVGLDHLDGWITDNEEPPSAPRLEREDGELQRDEYGNIVGGLRLPPIDVPVAFYDGIPCALRGRTYQPGDATLQKLYSTHDDYVNRMQAATDEALDEGYLLSADAEDLMSRVRGSSIVEQSGSARPAFRLNSFRSCLRRRHHPLCSPFPRLRCRSSCLWWSQSIDVAGWSGQGRDLLGREHRRLLADRRGE
jgi:hypothetical protein